MRDVARLADVSVFTVSAVINKKHRVSAKLTERVRKAMEALDYFPDHVARSLKVGRTNVIGMIVPDITNPFFAELTRSVYEEAQRKGYSVMVCDSNDDPTREGHHLSTLYARRVDGLLVAGVISDIHYDSRLQRRLPIVFLDCLPTGIVGHGAVIIDNVGAACQATQHLIHLGHERIAIITGRLDRSSGADRLEGYRRAMQEARLPVYDEYLQRGDFHAESGYRCGLELMRLPVPPTAIFPCNNRMTLGLLRALGEIGVPCPDRVSVVGFDDADWATLFKPKLTCVVQPTYQMGKRATELLLQKLQSWSKNPQIGDRTVIVHQAELRVRESTAPPCMSPVIDTESCES